MACARSIWPFTRHVWRFCGHVDLTDGVDVVEGAEVSSTDRVDSTQSLASTKNPFPPRNVSAAAIPLRLFGRALHAFARGSVLFGEMLVFGAIPTGLQLERACGLFFHRHCGCSRPPLLVSGHPVGGVAVVGLRRSWPTW